MAEDTEVKSTKQLCRELDKYTVVERELIFKELSPAERALLLDLSGQPTEKELKEFEEKHPDFVKRMLEKIQTQPK